MNIIPTIHIIKYNEAEDIIINYSFGVSHFGKYLVASSQNQITNLIFSDDTDYLVEVIQKYWGKTEIFKKTIEIHNNINDILNSKFTNNCKLNFLLKGTNFQLSVWEELIKIPYGTLTTYGEIAKNISKPKSYRAVANAVGDNPIAIFIPCHRVIRKDRSIGGYRWGLELKKKILSNEGTNQFE